MFSMICTCYGRLGLLPNYGKSVRDREHKGGSLIHIALLVLERRPGESSRSKVWRVLIRSANSVLPQPPVSVWGGNQADTSLSPATSVVAFTKSNSALHYRAHLPYPRGVPADSSRLRCRTHAHQQDHDFIHTRQTGRLIQPFHLGFTQTRTAVLPLLVAHSCLRGLTR